MAAIKLAYLGGGSTRAAGTIASLMEQGDNFDGSEVSLIDLNSDRLGLIQEIGTRMARHRGLDITFTATTDRPAGLADADVVLTGFRPGGFEARAVDERVPLRHGVIGQETQGPGGFFMALRSVKVIQELIEDMSRVCPDAWIFNYTNPVNIVSQAATVHSDARIVSFCEGPIVFPRHLARIAGLDPDKVKATMVGVNHNCWSTEHTYDGEDLIPLLNDAYEERRREEQFTGDARRLLHLAVTYEAIPSQYFKYYYFKDEILAELQAKPTTRAEDIIANVPDYWAHYQEQAQSDDPQLDPTRSRGGVHELELAIDAMDAMFNDRGEVLPVNVPNHGSLPGFPDDCVVEVTARIDRSGFVTLPHEGLAPHIHPLVESLAEYQMLAGEAAWGGTRTDAIRALTANPLVPSLPVAETIYDEMASALRPYLPDRLVG